MQRITSALFLDFDNILSGLLELDRGAALALAERPGDLVRQLGIHGLAVGDRRDLLVRRAYLNPKGTVQDTVLGNDRGRLYLDRFRPHLVRAGFEVIDCPALTTRQKNAGDIRIVIDVLAALDSSVRYDEIIIASSDADFTPLLLKLRAEDRRTTIITAGVLAPAYQAVADRYIDEQQLIGLLLPVADSPEDGDPPEPPQGDDLVTADPATSRSVDLEGTPVDAETRALEALNRLVADASEPVNLASAGAAIHRAAGTDIIRDTNWFGNKTFTEFIQASDPTLRISSDLLWDPARHDAPPERPIKAAPGPAMPAFISELCTATDMPRLESASWGASFEALAEYAATHTFALTEATAWTRDILSERGYDVGRRVLSFVIRGCLFVSVRLDASPPPTAVELREAFVASIAERARSAGLEATEDELDLLEAWLSGVGDPSAT